MGRLLRPTMTIELKHRKQICKFCTFACRLIDKFMSLRIVRILGDRLRLTLTVTMCALPATMLLCSDGKLGVTEAMLLAYAFLLVIIAPPALLYVACEVLMVEKKPAPPPRIAHPYEIRRILSVSETDQVTPGYQHPTRLGED